MKYHKIIALKNSYLNCFEILISQDVPNNVGEGADISNDKTSISDSALRTYFNSTELLQEVNSGSQRVYYKPEKFYLPHET